MLHRSAGLLIAALAISFSSSCGPTRSLHRDRLVVPHWAFEHAGKSNRDIIRTLPAREAFEVLEELGRIEKGALSEFLEEFGRTDLPADARFVTIEEKEPGESEEGASPAAGGNSSGDDNAVPSTRRVSLVEQDRREGEPSRQDPPNRPSERDRRNDPATDDANQGDERRRGGQRNGRRGQDEETDSGLDAEPIQTNQDDVIQLDLGARLAREENLADHDRYVTLASLPRRNVLQSGHYFSTLTAVAIEEGLRPTAIPALVVGYRPDMDGIDWLPRWVKGTGVGLDLLVGGALSPLSGDSGEGNDIELAVGLGLTLPWSDSGALSVGAVTWRSNRFDENAMESVSNTEVALYVGVSIGSFKVSTQGN